MSRAKLPGQKEPRHDSNPMTPRPTQPQQPANPDPEKFAGFVRA